MVERDHGVRRGAVRGFRAAVEDVECEPVSYMPSWRACERAGCRALHGYRWGGCTLPGAVP